MNRKLLVLDLDGTLTNSQKEVTQKTRAAIRQLQEKGHVVALASGRPTGGIRQVAEALQLKQTGGYVLAFNGGKILDWGRQTVLFQQTLAHKYLKALQQAADDYGLVLVTYQDTWMITQETLNPYTELERDINHLQVRQVENFVAAIDFPINKCLYTGEPEQIRACEEMLLGKYGTELSIFKSEDYFLEVMPQNIDKAASIERLIQLIGIKREDVVCCGDGYNDISMIRYAGVGVAMANAKEVVKEAADVITGSNDEDGLVPVIEAYF